jgi:hypothetical protein
VTSLIAAAGQLPTAAAVLVALLVLLSTRKISVALPVALELLMAAGLIRLSASSTWQAIASAALIVLIRKVVVHSMSPRRRPGLPWVRRQSPHAPGE